MVSSSISDAVIASVHSEKTRLKKLMMRIMMMIIIIMNTSQENDGLLRSPEIDFRHETEARKVMVDLKFDALLRASRSRVSRNVIWKFVCIGVWSWVCHPYIESATAIYSYLL